MIIKFCHTFLLAFAENQNTSASQSFSIWRGPSFECEIINEGRPALHGFTMVCINYTCFNMELYSEGPHSERLHSEGPHSAIDCAF